MVENSEHPKSSETPEVKSISQAIMRIGIFGGSFDPIHFGHLLLAETCREHCQLDEVWFVPASVPPHKTENELASDKARLEMLELATAGHEAFRVSSIELARGGVSYTVDTLLEVKRQQPDAELFLLMGADLLPDLATWREPKQICELATLLVVRRPGSPEPDFAGLSAFVSEKCLEEMRDRQLKMPQIEIAGTEIRQRVADNRSIRYRTPRAVEKYIETHGLYRQASSTCEKP